MDDFYHIRMRRAVILSVVIHLLLLLPLSIAYKRGGPGPTDNPVPIRMHISEPEPTERQQLVDVTQPSETLPDTNTNMIAEHNSQARDAELREGREEGPRVEREDEFEALAMRHEAAQPMPPMPEIPPTPEPTPDENPENEPSEETVEPNSEPTEEVAEEPESPQEDPDTFTMLPEAVENPENEKPEEATPPPTPPEELPEPVEPALPSPMQMAKAIPTGQAELGNNQVTGRPRDANRHKGMTNFTAIADQVAPYLKQVKLRVEKRWNEALLHRYNGLIPTEATIECVISPDGNVVEAEITGGPRDPIYAALCRKAVFDAGPFGPFTFDVPDMYRNQNLEIRWTFSFF